MGPDYPVSFLLEPVLARRAEDPKLNPKRVYRRLRLFSAAALEQFSRPFANDSAVARRPVEFSYPYRWGSLETVAYVRLHLDNVRKRQHRNDHDDNADDIKDVVPHGRSPVVVAGLQRNPSNYHARRSGAFSGSSGMTADMLSGRST
jgi:hypothetical protein